jgi:EAL domain-containing protein (putative c-di-GMP-specific phosphodiesterase class I)
MYHAKENGRNTYRFFDERMNVNALERLHLENGLRRALENEEFSVYYQPQVDLASGRIIGTEALLRWFSGVMGGISPARFIPLAEECGLIVPIGEWVLKTACRQARQWQDEGLPAIPVAVNLSALQFRRADIVATVSRALEESGLEGCWLELELTESLLMQSGPEVEATLGRLKALGVRLSIDDFGTGYSSLAYLKRFPVDRLKIDQSFVRDITEDPDDAAIVRAIIQLGRSLRLEVIAEGTETPEQMDFLRYERCTAAQGYLFAPPLPAEAVTELLRIGSLPAAPIISG